MYLNVCTYLNRNIHQNGKKQQLVPLSSSHASGIPPPKQPQQSTDTKETGISPSHSNMQSNMHSPASLSHLKQYSASPDALGEERGTSS